MNAEPPQTLQGYSSNEEWQALLAHLDRLVREMETLPDPQLRRRVFELLNAVDALHREALHRLVRLFKQGVLETVVTDPAIHTLMELYDLLPADGAATPGEAPRAHRFPSIPVRVESAAARAAPVRPHWLPVLEEADAPAEGSGALRVADGMELLLCRVGREWFALEARCALDGASLALARIAQYVLICPAHTACFYDIRQGSRIGGGGRIACRPVRVDERGRVQIGVGMPFTPQLPSH